MTRSLALGVTALALLGAVGATLWFFGGAPPRAARYAGEAGGVRVSVEVRAGERKLPGSVVVEVEPGVRVVAAALK